jgi:hypothetical protein
VKADPAVQRRLLDLAEVDAELNRIDHRRRTLPELAEIETAEKTVQEKRDALVAVETTLGDLNRDAKRQEDDIEAVRSREDRDRKLLKDGNVGARQLADLEHELGTLSRRQSTLEDDLLELMERREAVELDTGHARVELDKAQQGIGELQERRDAALVDLDTAQARADERRTTLVKGVPADLAALYDRIRTQKGIGAALLRARRCGACRLELDRHQVAQIKGTAADEVIQHDECGAILVRTGESGL